MSPQLMNGNVITEPRIRFEDVPFAALRKKSRQFFLKLLIPVASIEFILFIADKSCPFY